MKNKVVSGLSLLAAAFFGFAISPHAGVADTGANYTTVSATILGSSILSPAQMKTRIKGPKGSYLVGHVKFPGGLFDAGTPVQVITSMRSLDTGDRTQCGFYAQGVSSSGFDLYLDKGSTGGCYSASYTWAASQPKKIRI